MEGLIPYLLHAIKKTRPQHKYRTSSFSGSGNNSNRSYHLLTGDNESLLEGSSHRRGRSELPVAAVADVFSYSRSYKEGRGASAAVAPIHGGGSKKGFYPYQVANNRKYD